MRVISGSARGIKLQVPNNSSTRPMLELARGAVFNILYNQVSGAEVLDLYAGSGALGLEALSRGAKSAVFVEADSESSKIIAENLNTCGLIARGRVVIAAVEVFLEGMQGGFDLIFIDPPYREAALWLESPAAARVMDSVLTLLNPTGIIIFRLEKGDDFPENWHNLLLWINRTYGRSRICFYKCIEK